MTTSLVYYPLHVCLSYTFNFPSCARNGQAILISRQQIIHLVPEDILSVISVDEWLHSLSPAILDETLPMVSEEGPHTSENGDMAPFVYVKQYHEDEKKGGTKESSQTKSKHQRRRVSSKLSGSNPMMNGKQGTVVDLEPVAAVIKRVLETVSSGLLSSVGDGGSKLLFDRAISPMSISQLPTVAQNICYTVISSFLSHGMAFPGIDDLLWLNLDPPDDTSNDSELLSRSKTMSDYAGVLGHVIISRIGNKENNLQLSRAVCSVLVKLSMASCQRVVQHACCGLIAMLSSLRFSKNNMNSSNATVWSSTTTSYDADISTCLVSFVEFLCSFLKEGSNDAVAIPLIDGKYFHWCPILLYIVAHDSSSPTFLLLKLFWHCQQ